MPGIGKDGAVIHPHVREAIDSGLTCDITTTGRSSGESRRIEIWYFVVDGDVYITGTPGRRHWLANVRANPRMTFHVKEGAHADLPASAVEITDLAERRRIMHRIRQAMSWYEEQGHSPDEWETSSPLIRVDLDP